MLILAGVSIASLTGDNGILTRADTARKETNKQSAKEQVQVEVLGSMGKNGAIDIERLNENLKNIQGLKYEGSGISESNKIESLPAKVKIDENDVEIEEDGEIIVNAIEVGEKVIGSNEVYANNGTAVIPVGFAIVPGLDDVSKGLVISDKENDISDEGNQFVWVPVKDFKNNFKRVSGYSPDGNLQKLESSEIDGEGNNSQYESEYTKKEAKEMYASVRKNGGFYIGRYEAGKDKNGNLVVQKNMNVYNNIPWSKIYKEDTGGVVELSRNLYDNSNIGVKSTLCYGVQWDATLNFIDNNYINNSCSSDSVCVNAIFMI